MLLQEAAIGLGIEGDVAVAIVETCPPTKTTRSGKAFAHGPEVAEEAKVASSASASPTSALVSQTMEGLLQIAIDGCLEAGRQSPGPYVPMQAPA